MARCPNPKCKTPNNDGQTNCKICGTALAVAASSITKQSPQNSNQKPSLVEELPISAYNEPTSAASKQIQAASPEHQDEPSFELSNFSEILSRGQQALDLDLKNLPPDSNIEEIIFTSDDNAFTAKANLRKMSKSFTRIRLPVTLITAPGLQNGTYDFDISIHVKAKHGELRLFEGSVRLPVFDPDHIRLMQGGPVTNSVVQNIMGGSTSINDSRGANYAPQIGMANPSALVHSTKTFSGPLIERVIVSTSICVAASIAMPTGSSWRMIRLFALKNTVLGRQITAPDAAEADIQLNPPTGEKHDQIVSYLSRQHAVIRWNSNHFDLDTLGKWGITVNTDRLGKDSPLKALKAGQVIRMPGIFPEGVVALEVLASARHTLVLVNRDKGELLVIVAPETKPTAIPADWNPTVPIFFHHHGAFWLRDAASNKETQIAEGQDIVLGATGKGKMAAQPYPELNLVDYTPGKYADTEVVGA